MRALLRRLRRIGCQHEPVDVASDDFSGGVGVVVVKCARCGARLD